MSQVQLYKASVASGLKNMSWTEFSGLTISVGDNLLLTEDSEGAQGFSGVGAYASAIDAGGSPIVTAGIQYAPTVGSVLVLNFAEVIKITEDYYAPGSLCSSNLQITVTVENNEFEDYFANKYELNIAVMNSGVLALERGTASCFVGLLNKKDVLEASDSQEHYSHGTIKRMIGGSLINNLRSAMGWISAKLPFVRSALGKVNHSICANWP